MKGSWNIKGLSNEELVNLGKDIREEIETRQGKWDRYIYYLRTWADDNADYAYAGQSPASYDEWCDMEDKHYEQLA